MPIVPPPSIPNQLTPSGVKPYTSQGVFASAIGEVQSWNPNASSTMIGQWLNNAVRKFYDRRNWYGLLTRGQIVTPRYYSVGQIAVTLGSTAIVGLATTFTPDMVGRQLRVGFNNPIYNIIAVADATHLTIDLPWGGKSYPNIGYFIAKYYYSIPNIRYIHAAVNLQMQQRMVTNLNQVSLNSIDPSRQSGGVFSWGIAAMPADPDGNYQFELYPVALAQQAIPYCAYIQPPNLVDDNDNLPAFMRWDIIKSHAISDCLRYKTKDNPNYSEAVAMQIAKEKLSEFETEVVRAEQADENLYRQDIVLDFEQYPMFTPGGAFWDIQHAVSAGGMDWR